MRRRARQYATGQRPNWRPPVPCVSVGNISVGGSGKTPLVQWVCGRACGLGHAPLVLTRGYRAQPPRLPYAVSPDSPPRYAGDEPLLLAQSLARNCPAAKVVVDPIRTRSGPWALREFHSGLVVLDDAFQHLAVQRDLNLVLLTPDDLGRDWDMPLPAGRWREGAPALERADAFLLKVGPQGFAPHRDLSRARLECYKKPVYPFRLRATGLAKLDARPVETGTVAGNPYVLATGVARPAQVADTAEALLGAPPADVLAFPDHHGFTAADAERVAATARALGAAVLTTPKDAVKLRELPQAAGFLMFCLDLDFEPGLHCQAAAPDFPAFFNAWLRISLKNREE